MVAPFVARLFLPEELGGHTMPDAPEYDEMKRWIKAVTEVRTCTWGCLDPPLDSLLEPPLGLPLDSV